MPEGNSVAAVALKILTFVFYLSPLRQCGSNVKMENVCVAVVSVPLVIQGFIDVMVSQLKALLLCVRTVAIYSYV